MLGKKGLGVQCAWIGLLRPSTRTAAGYRAYSADDVERLREVLAYPLKADKFSTSAFNRALYRFGLERLALLLDRTHR